MPSRFPDPRIRHQLRKGWNAKPAGGGGGTVTVEWGDIGGTLSDQTDLQTALNGKQTSSTNLTALSGLATAADKLSYWTGSGTAALADFTSAARGLVANNSAAGMRNTLGLVALATGIFDGRGINGNTNITPSDAGKYVRVIGSTNRTFTLAPDSSGTWPTGAFVLLFPTTTGTLTVARGAGVSMYYGTNANRTIAAAGFAIILNIGADEWVIFGHGIT